MLHSLLRNSVRSFTLSSFWMVGSRLAIFSSIERTKNRAPTNKNSETTDNKFVAVPYVQGAFERIKKTFNKYNITVVGRGDHNLKKFVFSKVKDQVPKSLQSHLIYRIKCSCGLVYIGQTLQYLEKRISNHQYHIRIKDNKHSALCDHVINTEHVVNWDDVEIIHRENRQHKRDVLEMIYIKKTPNTINKQIECKFLSNTYNHILQVPTKQPVIDITSNNSTACDN